MSNFDKEAEREKLRKRFAEEEEDRETTERMSELLLQGATMTNTHCDTCGDPLFRYDGQTFCSTCQRAVGDETATDDGTADSDEPTPERAADDSQRIAVDDPHDQSDQTDETRDQGTSPARQPEPTTHNRRAPPSQTADDVEKRTHSSENTNDIAATEASLSRTLRELATKAEELDDLGRTREHLAAAREAAEALEAVRNARR